jgi:hypothetical protein
LLEGLMALAVCSVLIDAVRRDRVPIRPAPFGPAIAVMVLGLLVGTVVGHYAGEGFNPITEEIRPILPLIIVPWLTVNVVRDTADLRRAIGLIAILTVVKAALGVAGVLTHIGVIADGTTITYYEPAANLLAMIFVLAMVASAVGRIPMDRLARWAGLLVLLSLVLSLRRSFWLGTVAGLPLVLILAIGPVGKRFLVPAAAVLAAAIWISASTGIVFNSDSALGQRVTSIAPSRIEANPEDAYRLDEQHNVIAAIRASPLVGLGLAVPWQERYPLSVEPTGGNHLYVHVAVLWFWLKLGVLGVIAYFAYLFTAIVTGIRVFRRHRDPRVRVASAGVAGGLVGLIVVETTATFTGSDMRVSVILGCIAGLLSVAHGEIGTLRRPSGRPADVREERLPHRYAHARHRDPSRHGGLPVSDASAPE